MRTKPIKDITGTILTPGEPDKCKGNGATLNKRGKLIACCCDECDYLQLCAEKKQRTRRSPEDEAHGRKTAIYT